MNCHSSSTEYIPFLSKSRFIKGMQCHKALWFQTHRPDLKPETPPDRQAIFDSGHEVGILAQQLYPGGTEVPFDGVPLAGQIELTRSLIDSGIDTIYEAAFSHNNIFVKADILQRVGDTWQLGEVKSSTKAKEVYLNDVAVQYHVITGCGIKVSSAGLVLIDTDYVRNGEIEPDKLFKWIDVTEEVLSRQEAIQKEASRQRSMLTGPEPAIGIGCQCHDPYECDYVDHCWADIPSPSVFDFVDIGKPDPFALYHQGIIRMEDTPPEVLGWRQKLQLEGHLNKKNVFDADAVREFIDDLWYPMAFLDFETTCMMPVPLFDGTSPYKPAPFQFSLHIQDAPGAALQHREFLGAAQGDPQEGFLHSLIEAVPLNACILTWNSGFEGRIMRYLAQLFPDLGKRIQPLIGNLADLMAPFRRKHIYHWQFGGSYSIKSVLPALVPELTYDSLAIRDGGMASEAWLRMRSTDDPDMRERLRQELLEYCYLDTLAMVRILEKMREMVLR